MGLCFLVQTKTDCSTKMNEENFMFSTLKKENSFITMGVTVSFVESALKMVSLQKGKHLLLAKSKKKSSSRGKHRSPVQYRLLRSLNSCYESGGFLTLTLSDTEWNTQLGYNRHQANILFHLQFCLVWLRLLSPKLVCFFFEYSRRSCLSVTHSVLCQERVQHRRCRQGLP